VELPSPWHVPKDILIKELKESIPQAKLQLILIKKMLLVRMLRIKYFSPWYAFQKNLSATKVTETKEVP